MANPKHNRQTANQSRQKGGGHPPVPRGEKASKADPMRTAAWPGVPGKTQSKSRSSGIRKLRQSPREEGL